MASISPPESYPSHGPARPLRSTRPHSSPPRHGVADSLGPLRFRVITKEDAPSYAPLRGFSAGDPSKLHGDERLATEEVQRIVERLRNGSAIEQTLVLLEKASGELVAICGITESALAMALGPEDEPTPVVPPGACINVLARDARYRGTGAGTAVLRYAVSVVIPRLWSHWELPYVFGAVQPDNAPSHAAFDAAGFLHLPGFAPDAEDSGQHTRLLAANRLVSLPL